MSVLTDHAYVAPLKFKLCVEEQARRVLPLHNCPGTSSERPTLQTLLDDSKGRSKDEFAYCVPTQVSHAAELPQNSSYWYIHILPCLVKGPTTSGV